MRNDSKQHRQSLSAEERVPRELTHLQTLIWTGQHLDPESPVYNTAFRIVIRKMIDPGRFENAFRYVVEQSAEMRTTIELVHGLPRPRIAEGASFEFKHLDFSENTHAEEFAKAWCEDRCRLQLPLSELMFDTALIKVDEAQFVWYVCQHHLICDAWSVTQLLRLVDEAYQAIGSNGNEPLPLVEEVREAAEPVDVAIGETRKAIFYGRRHSQIASANERITIVEATSEGGQQIAELASRAEVRSFSQDMSRMNVVLTLLFSYLSRVGEGNVFSVGMPFHGRRTPAEQRSLGAYVEFSPVTVEISPHESFLSLLKKVQTATTKYLQQATRGPIDTGTHASFNTICNYIHADFKAFDGTPVEAEWLHPGCCDREHHLRLHAENFSGVGLTLKADLNQDVFDVYQQEQLRAHFRTLLASMTTNLQQPIAEVPLLSEVERLQLLEQFNQVAPGVVEPSMIATFHDQAERAPQAVAINEQGHEVTYATLRQRVRQAAAQLARLGCQPGDRVAVMLGRSADAVVSMLAIMEAGMAFVPVDPTWPAKRIAYVLEDCQAAAAISRPGLEFVASKHVRRLVMDDLTQGDGASGTNPTQDDSAYVLYTSGSTGKPKGVEITHGSLANYVHWAVEYYGRHGERPQASLSFPLFTPLTFDLTLTSIFVPLASGGTIHVYPEAQRGSDIALLDVIEQGVVDVIKLTPSHLSLLAGRQIEATRVRQLILGGENLTQELASQIFKAFPDGLTIHNEYGPTEATVGCVVFSCTAGDELQGRSVPIGRPIKGAQAFVLNSVGQPVPRGVVGELYLGGVGLAKGYFGDPERTADRFEIHQEGQL